MAPASGAKAAKRADGQAFATSAADAATRPSTTPAKLTPAPVPTPRSQPSASPAISQPIAMANSGGVFSPAPYDSSMKVQDGRVRGPVPSKLKGVVKAKDGSFNVMLMAGPATGDMHTRDAEAKRASENTAMAAKKAVEQGPPSARRAKFVPVASQEPDVPKPVVPPPRRLPLSDYETKAEQARLLTLLRTIPPVDVVNQICKALAYFGGTPDAPPPADGSFPFSEKANGPGKFFVGWISEIFPYVPNLAIGPPVGLSAVQVAVQSAPLQAVPMQASPTHIASTQAPPSYAHPVEANQAQASPAQTPQQPTALQPQSSGKRARGRPKGSGSSKTRQDKAQTTGPVLLPDAHSETAQRGVGDDSWVVVKENGTDTAAAQISRAGPSVVGVSTPVTAPVASNNTVSSVKRRGRPKGSKNRPKEATAVPSLSAVGLGTGSEASQPVQVTHTAPPSQEPQSSQPSFDGQGLAAQPLQSQEAAQPAANVSSFTPVNQTTLTPVAPASAASVLATPDTATPSKKRVGRPKGSKTKTKPDAVKPATANANHSQSATTASSTAPPQPTTMQQGFVTHSQPSQDHLNEQPINRGKVTLSLDAQTRAQGHSDSSSQNMTASSSTWGAPPPRVKASQVSRVKHNHSQGQLNHKEAESSSQISSVAAPPSAPKPLAANPNQSGTPAPQPERQKRKYTKRKSKDISSASSATASHPQPTSQQTLRATTDIGSSSQGTSLTHQDSAGPQPADHKADDSPAPPPAKKARKTKKRKPDVKPVVAQNKPSSVTAVPAIAPSSPAATNVVSGAVGSVDHQVQPPSCSAAQDGLSLDEMHGSPHGQFGLESPTMENYEAQLQAQLDQESEPQLQLLQDALRDDGDESSNLDSSSHQIEQQPQQTQQQSPKPYQQQWIEQTPWLYRRRAQQHLRNQAMQLASQSFQKQSTNTSSQNKTSLPQQRGSTSQSQSASPVASQATASAAPTSQSLYRATGYQLNSKQTYSPQQTGQQQSSSWQQTAQPPTQGSRSQQYPAADQQQQKQRQQPQQYTSNQQSYSGAQSQWAATEQQQASGQQRHPPQAAAAAAAAGTTSYNSKANQPMSFPSGFSSSNSYRSSPAEVISPFNTNQRLQSGNSSMSTPTSYRTSSSQSLGQQQTRTSSMDSLNPAMNPYQQQQHQRSSSSNMSTANPQQGMSMGLGAASNMPSFTTNSQTAEWNLFGSSNAGQQHQSSNDMNLGTAPSYGVNNRTSSFSAAGMPATTSVYEQASLSGYDASGVLGRQGGYYGNR